MNTRYFEIVRELADKPLAYLKEQCKRQRIPYQPANQRSLVKRIAASCARRDQLPSEEEQWKVVDLAIEQLRQYQAVVKMIPPAESQKIDWKGKRGWVVRNERQVMEAEERVINKIIGAKPKRSAAAAKRA